MHDDDDDDDDEIFRMTLVIGVKVLIAVTLVSDPSKTEIPFRASMVLQ